MYVNETGRDKEIFGINLRFAAWKVGSNLHNAITTYSHIGLNRIRASSVNYCAATDYQTENAIGHNRLPIRN